jgi:predicted PurR-regulated permease PerM
VPALWAILLAFMLFPANRRLRLRVRGRKGLAATVLTILVLLGLVLPAVAVGYAFFDQALELAGNLSDTAARHRIAGVEDVLNLPVIGHAITWLQERFGLDPTKLQAWLVEALRKVMNWIVTHGRQAVVGALGLVANLTLMLFLLFFFFRDGDESVSRLMALVPLDAARKERLVRRLSDVTRAVVSGTVVTAIVQGTLVGAGFWIVGLPSPIVFGALTAVASFIPIVGTGLVVGPAVIFLATQGVWWKTIFLLAWGVVVAGSADNVLRPMLISGRANIGTLAAFVGAIGGLAAFGLIGLFLGPALVALVIALLEFAQEALAKEQAPKAG